MPSRSLTKQRSATGKKPALVVSRNARCEKTPLALDFDHSGFRTDVEFALSRAGKPTPLAADHVRAEFALRYRFPAEFVAFLDDVATEEGTEHLSRSIISHGPSLSDVTREVIELDANDQRRLMVVFVEPADDERTSPLTVR